MNVGFIGLGTRGTTCAIIASQHGHSVLAYDVDPTRMNRDLNITYSPPLILIEESEIIFINVPNKNLLSVFKEILECYDVPPFDDIILVINSHITYDEMTDILIDCNKYMHICYSPLFIYDSDIVKSCTDLSFIMLASYEKEEIIAKVRYYYSTITSLPPSEIDMDIALNLNSKYLH